MFKLMKASFPGKLNSVTVSAFVKRKTQSNVSKRLLYRKAEASVIAVLVFFAASASCVGQEEHPRISPQRNRPQENKKPKKGKEPRAVGILQLGGGKGTLIPVAILIDGRFYDASVYKADPIPMALESGTVYEAEQAGDTQGLFTVNGALHSKTMGSANPWIGTGTYLPQGAEAPKATRKAEDVPVGLDNSGDEPPKLTRKGSSKPVDNGPSSNTAPSGSGSTGQTNGTAEQPANGPPTVGTSAQQKTDSKMPSSGEKTSDQSAKTPTAAGPVSSGQASSSSVPTGQNSPSQTSPVQPSPSQPSSGQASSGQPTSGQSGSNSADENYYRPTLRRGKPTTSPSPDEDATVTKKDSKNDSSTGAVVQSGVPKQLIAAISDAGGPEPQSYKLFWKTGEEEERRKQMLTLAANEVQAYAKALAKNQIPARPAAAKSGGARKVPAKTLEPVLENVQFHAFDVWLTNQAVMIFSAEAHFPLPNGATSGAAESYSVTLVTRTDIYGNLQKLYSAVTDKFHLDVTPRLELIDVVDADADGRGELLFRETTDTGAGYVIYRATADKLWKMFDSLNAE
jgi:hypothetical protein